MIKLAFADHLEKTVMAGAAADGTAELVVENEAAELGQLASLSHQYPPLPKGQRHAAVPFSVLLESVPSGHSRLRELLRGAATGGLHRLVSLLSRGRA